MLDVITDFWKPVKKTTQEKPDLDRLVQGSVITFGTVPQTIITNRAYKVTASNTYQFGDDSMTSFVLTNDQDEHSVSLIVASAEGEQYLAISRRIVFAERMRMFDPAELDAVVEQPEADKLTCREIDSSWKHWVVSTYKKEISGAKGSFVKGVQRGQPIPANATILPFEYMLLTSESNEYAIEIERYADGRLELYATVYRRVTDIVSVENPNSWDAISKTSAPVLEIVKPPEEITPQPAVSTENPAAPFSAPVAAEPKKETAESTFVAKPQNSTPQNETPKNSVQAEMPTPTPPVVKPENTPAATHTISQSSQPKPEKPMQTNTNGIAHEDTMKPKLVAATSRAIEMENDSIECELRVANKVIEEAIRNEMRLSDVVRRIIALPVANPESVNIPITLTDSDYQLLAIRYGMPASDRNAIKTRIIEEMNDFSGKK